MVQRGRLNADETRELLETIVFQELSAAAARHGMSRLAILEGGGWQARILRACAGVSAAQDAQSLRRAMQDPQIPVIFLPHDAMVTQEIVAGICVENPLDKFVILETEAPVGK